jgi:glycosyltransferase involved in cell wall biosynthesis
VRLYREEKPDIAHHIALKPAVLGALAARLARRDHIVTAINGLGFAFTAQTVKARLARTALRTVFRFGIDRPDAAIVVQNDDDRRRLIAERFIGRASVAVIRGSGVDLEHFQALPEPETHPPVVAVVTRMLGIKGIATLVAASGLLRERGIPHRIWLVGRPDPENASSLTEAQLRSYAAEPGIEWLGHRSDVREIWAQAHIAALTSLGGEGVPKSLLESAACGRPIVATNVPGCRDVVADGVNGFLVAPGDPAATADALARLIGDRALRRNFGAQSRRIAEERFSDQAVAAETLAIYRRLLETGAAP